MDGSSFRSQVLCRHFKNQSQQQNQTLVQPSTCFYYSSPDLSEAIGFDTSEMRKLMDGHNCEERDWVFNLMIQSGLFVRKDKGTGRGFALPDYNQTMEQQRVMTMKRIEYLVANGVFDGFLTTKGPQHELRNFALADSIGVFDHSFGIKLGVHFSLW